MGRNPRHRIKILTEQELNNIVFCSICFKERKYREMYFYVDESNYAITKNSKPLCKDCKNERC